MESVLRQGSSLVAPKRRKAPRVGLRVPRCGRSAASWASWRLVLALATWTFVAGCGINRSRLATEQMVVSDAVDRTVASIDFSPLSGHTVYFDTQYLDGINLGTNGNVKYVISSLRQQMMAYDCRLQEKADTADYIVEARVGVLANDGYEVTYGVPGNAALGTASILLASPVALPAMPELSLGRRNHHAGTAKIGVFAYDRQTREPVWQAGVRKGASEARDMWIFGMGPYEKKSSAVKKSSPWRRSNKNSAGHLAIDPVEAYTSPIVFERGVRGQAVAPAVAEVSTAGHLAPIVQPQVLSPAPGARPALQSQDHVP
jgi:hypothetical protein